MKPYPHTFISMLPKVACLGLLALFNSFSLRAQTTIFNETFPTTDAAWNGSSDTPQDNAGWNVYQGNGDNNDVRVATVGGKTGLMFDDCDQGFTTSSSAYDAAYITINLSGYKSVTITYDWYDVGTDAGEGHKLEYSTDATTGANGTWTTLNSELNPSSQSTWNNAVGPFSIPDAAAVSTFRIRFTGKSNAAGENTYIDNILVRGVSAPQLSASVTNTTCATCTNGAVDLTVTGGTSPFTYTWSHGATSQDISSLPGGTYRVTVTDNASQTVSAAYDVLESIYCEDFSSYTTGTKTSTEWTRTVSGSPQYFEVRSNKWHAEDLNNQESYWSSKLIDITNHESISASVNLSESGNMRSSDYIRVYYKIDGGAETLFTTNGDMTNDFSPVTASVSGLNGNSTFQIIIRIKDNEDESTLIHYFDDVCVTAKQSLALSYSTTNAKCNGTGGAVDLSVEGGIAPYTYAWSNSATSQDLSNRAGGNYTVTVTDATAATVSTTATVSITNTLNGSIAPTHISCYNANNGLADLTPSGGNSPYTYLWSNSATSQDISGLSAGSYTVTITDAYSCTVSKTTTINNPAALNGSITGTNPSYYGSSNGSADLTPSGGTSPYTYLWSTGATSQDASGLAAGTYSVTVTDSRGCSVIKSVQLSNPFSVQPYCETFTYTDGTTTSAEWTRDVSGITFGGSDHFEVRSNKWSSLDLDGEGIWRSKLIDITNYKNLSVSVSLSESGNMDSDDYIRVYYRIDGGSETLFTTNGDKTDDFGSATASVSNLNGNSTLQIIVKVNNDYTSEYHYFDDVCVTGTLDMELSAAITKPSCNNADGSVNLTVTGGSSPFTYVWGHGPTSEDIASLAAGTYSVTVTDASSMSVSTTVEVTENNSLTATLTATNISCNGLADGSADLAPSGGSAPYTYAWSNGATSQDLSGLIAGTYVVTITGANSCTLTKSAEIIEPAVLNASVSSTNPSYNGFSDGSADLTPTGGTAPYTYSWSNSATTQDLSGVAAGTYNLTVTDARGCTKTTAATLTDPATAQPYCETFTYSNGTKSSSEWSINTAACNLGDGGYFEVRSNQFEASDLDGQAVWTSDEIQISGMTSVQVSVNLSESGTLESDDYIRVYYKLNGGAEVQFTTNGNMTDDFASATATQTGLSGNKLQIIIKADNDATDEYHYFDNVCVTGTVIFNIIPEVTNDTCIGGNGGAIDIEISNVSGTLPFTYSWSTGATSQDISGLSAGDYTVTVTDNSAQVAIRTITVGQENTFCNGAANCISRYYIIQAANSTTAPDFYYINDDDTTFSLTVINDQATEVYNAIGFNHMDGFFYGIKHSNPGAGEVFKIDFNGNRTSLGTPSGISGNQFKSGDVMEDGSYVVFAASNHVMTRINVTTTPPTIISSHTFSNLDPYDFATNPRDRNLYGYDRYAKRFFYIDTAITTVTYFGTTYSGTDYQMGSAFFDEFGNMYVYTNNGSGSQIYFKKVDVGVNGSGTGNMTNVATGPAVTWSDGCSCPFGFFMTLSISPSTAMAGDTVEYTYVISNMSLTSTHLTFNESLDNGLTFVDGSLENPFTGNEGAYGGSSTLNITDFKIPSKAIDTLRVLVVLPHAPMDSIIYNQGRLTNLPSGYADSLLSDYTVTEANADATPLVIQNRQPFAVNESVSTCYNTAKVIDVLANDSDWDGSLVPSSVQIITAPANGSTSINTTTGAITYTPNSGFTGNNTIVYRVRDTGTPLPVKYDTATVTITVAPLLVMTRDNLTNVSCPNGTNGAIGITLSGGTTPYTYAWSHGATTQDVSGLEAETYSVTVTDGIGCTVTRNDTITQPAEWNTSSTITEASCTEISDGAVDLSVSGATSPYTYSWSNGAISQDLSGVAAASYTLTITDTAGCTVNRGFTVGMSSGGLIPSIAKTDISCNGADDGSLDLTVTGGASPYSYSWSTGASAQDLAGLSAATYTVTVTGSNGCTVSTSATIVNPAALSLSATVTNITCNGLTNGAIDLSVSGGRSPYTYNWGGGITTQDRSGLSAGLYTVTVTDASSCTASLSKLVLEAGKSFSALVLTGATSSTFPTSTVSGGFSQTLPASGSENFTFTFGNSYLPSGFTLNSGWAGTGTMTYTKNDANAASHATHYGNSRVTEYHDFNPGDVPNQSGSVYRVYGRGLFAFNGASGGVNHSWTVTYNFSGLANGYLPAGTLIGFTDIDGTPETALLSAMLASGSGAWLSASPLDYTTNSTHGQAAYNAGANTYYFDGPSVSNGAILYFTTKNLTSITMNLTSGNGGGSFGVKFAAPVTAPITTSESITNVLCNGSATGAVDLTVTGGTTPYSYAWSSGATTQDLSNKLANTYYVTVTDANSCTKLDTATITQPASALSASLTITDVTCTGVEDGSVTINASGGTPPYTYLAFAGAIPGPVDSSNASIIDYVSQTIDSLSPLALTIIITDTTGCETSVSGVVGSDGPILSVNTTEPTCAGGGTGSINISASGEAPFTYDWSNGASSEDLINVAAGYYAVTVTDNDGCIGVAEADISLPPFGSSFSITNASCAYSTNGAVDLTVSGGSAPFGYSWSNGSTSQDITNVGSGSYSVTVTDNEGCTISNTATVGMSSNITSNIFIVDVSVHGGSNGLINQTVSGGVAPYTYAWSNGATTKDITGIPAGGYSVTITDAGGCTLTKSGTVSQPGACPCTWLGTISDDWKVAGNWDCGLVPTDTCDVIIQNVPNICTIWGGDAYCRNLTVQANSNLVIINTAVLNIKGNLLNNGTIVRNSSTVKLSGNREQTISGSSKTRFHNLHIVNASSTGVRLSGSIEVHNELRLVDGYLFTEGDSVKMMSPEQGKLNEFGPNSFVVGKLYRKISNTQLVGYDFPVGDAGMPSRFFNAYIKSFALQGTTELTVWFDTLRQHSNEQLLESYLAPPQNVDDYYNYNVPYVKIASGDTTTSTNFGVLAGTINGVIDGVTGALLMSPTTYVNNIFNMEKTVETDGIMYSFIAPEGIWHFEPDQQPTGGYYHMVLSIQNFSGLSDNNFGVLKRPTGSNGEYWSAGGGNMNPFGGEGRRVSDGIAMRMYLTTFSEGGAGGGGGGGLPIELLDFKAELTGDDVELTWVTATEINNDYFTLEKSNGKEFKQIAIIPGAGNSSSTRYYSKMDYEPFAGTSYYRLKQTDYDGKFTYSNVVSVNYESANPEEESNELIVYPNPSGGNFSVVVKEATEKVVLSLFDNRGKLVMTETYRAEEDNHTHQVQVKGIPSGVYYLKADMGEKVHYTKKLMLFGEN